MSEYSVTVTEYAAKRLIGIAGRTSMAKANIDCPALWQAFCPHFDKLGPQKGPGSYGASVMINTEEFVYWATVEWAVEKPVPEGLDSLMVPAGPYARLTVLDLARVSEAYTFMYETWLSGRTEFSYAMDRPCLEFYPDGWKMNDPFEILMPLVKK